MACKTKGMSTHGVSRDPFGELSGGGGLPAGLRQRFPDRVLVMTTDRCFGRCPHCTRKFILGKSPVVDSPARLAACVEYVKRHRKVRDVLLSGGDVLTLRDADGLRAAVSWSAAGAVASWPVTSALPASTPVVVYP
jgi:L-lysine 2,3-aminomutase